MKTLTVKVPDTLFAEISIAAETRKVSKSDIVRERLTQPATEKPSLWDLMKDLVIESDNLPTDLSTNKAHMKGYGQSRSR